MGATVVGARPGLILSERGSVRRDGSLGKTEGLEERLWILRYWASWRKSRAKGRGTGRANRLSSRGLRASSRDPTVAFSFFPLSHFFSYLRLSFSPDLILPFFIYLSLWPGFTTMRNYSTQFWSLQPRFEDATTWHILNCSKRRDYNY